jgi:hypothetical protein
MTRDEFQALPRISSFFPIVFQKGGRWNQCSGKCNECKTRIEDDDLRGHVTHPFSNVYIVSAIGFCRPCDSFLAFTYRLHEDMGMTGIDPHTGEWARWESRPASLWTRLRKRMRKLLSITND